MTRALAGAPAAVGAGRGPLAAAALPCPSVPRDRLALAVALAGVLLIYGGSLFAGFVWDDETVILPAAARSPLGALRGALRGGVTVEGLALSYFRPLLDVSYALDGWVWGLRPFGFHLTNLLLYALCVILAHRLARRALGEGTAAAVAVAAFALHPVHVESVAWVQGRGDLLAFAAVASALLAFLRSLGGRAAWPWRIAAGAAALAGALAKEWALAAPALAAAWWLLLVRDGANGAPGRNVAPHRRLRDAAEALAPFAAALFVYAALRVAAMAGAGGQAPVAPALLTTTERWLVLGPVFARYLGLLVWPYPLNAYHLVTVPAGLLDARVLGGGLLMAATVAAAALAPRRAPRAALALWWFLLSILPVLPVLPIKGFTMAERYLFLPSFGFALGVGLLADWARRTTPGAAARRGLGLAAVAVALVWAGVASARVPDWAEQLAFYRAMVRTAPDSAFARNNLGQLLVAEGQVAEGIEHLRRAVALRPDMAFAHAGLGLASLKQGDAPAAAAALERAARLRPDDARILGDLAAALEVVGRAGDALAVLHRLEGLRPASAEVARRLARAYTAAGDRPRAEAYAARAARLAAAAPHESLPR